MTDRDDDLPAVDLRTLLGEMAALKAEVRTETTAARELRARVDREVEREADARRSLTRALVDLADRLEATARQSDELARAAATPPPPPPPRWFGLGRSPPDAPPPHAAAAASLHEGLQLTLRRLREHLEAAGVQRITALGRPFDPAEMSAVAAAARADANDGAVVEEIVSGYRDARGVLRLAQVVVNRIVTT